MRQIHPEFRDNVDPAEVYEDARRHRSGERPYVFLNMVTSVDGATVVSGVSEKLGGETDRHIFLLLRSLADGILVGAQTVRAEGYGPANVRAAFAAGRGRRGQSPAPRIAIVSGSLDLDWSSSLFTESRERPFVLTSRTADPARVEQAQTVADVVTAGHDSLDLQVALRELRRQGVGALLCEGGPSLNGALLRAGLVDELCLTLSPSLVGADGGSRITGRATLPDLMGLQLASVIEDDGSLFLRYLIA